MKKRVLISDDLSTEAAAIFRRAEGLEVDVKVGLPAAELAQIIGNYDALAVRSATKVTADLIAKAPRLKVVGRAGSGVDNIDLAAATRRGIVVMNTPGGNTVTVAEHTFAMLLSLARHIPAATASTKGGRWEKKKFQGRELFNKTLGVVGTGNIGSVVVQRALAFRMKVLAYDPFLSAEAAAKLGVELVSFDDLLGRADVVTVHVPLTDQTRHLFGATALAKMKRGALLVNCARGGIVDEQALAESLRAGHLGGVALDVFEQEPPAKDHPLFAFDNVVVAPHLGASTEEAQANVAVAIAEQMVDYLVTGTVRNAVNMPALTTEMQKALGPALVLAQRLGALAGQLFAGPIASVELDFAGELAQQTTAPLTAAALKGLLACYMDEPINEVSAPALAKERGIRVTETRTAEAEDYAQQVTLRVQAPGGGVVVSGAIVGKREPRVVRVGPFEIDAPLSGTLVVIHNADKPGVIGAVGTALGEAGINIAQFALARGSANDGAFALINIDGAAAEPVLAKVRQLPNVRRVQQVSLERMA